MENAAIHLSTPCPEKQQTLAFDAHPVKVKSWIDNLPLANSGETAHSIYHALTSINRTIIPVQHRCQILKLFRPPLRHVMNMLRKHYIGASFPLSDTGMKAALLARELQIEMAHGYKIALNNLVSHPSTLPTTAKTLPLLHHAMRYLIEALLTSYQTYISSPGAVWRDIHQMYLYAESKRLHESAIHDKEDPLISHHSISDLYKQALLLALASPYHLPQRDIGTIATTLDNWPTYAKLSFVIDLETPPESFLIDLEKDEPTSAPATQRNPRLTSYRLLELTDLINHLRELSSEEHTQTDKTPSHELLRKLITAWGAPAKRHFSRMNKNSRITVVLGLDALYQAYGGASSTSDPPATSLELSTKNQGKARFTSRPVMGMHGPQENWDGEEREDEERNAPDVWDVTTQTAYFKKQHAEKEAQTQKKAVQAAAPYTAYDCEVINESAGGACLAWEGDKKEAKFKIGELIGVSIVDQSDAHEWGVAVIRWMKHVKKSRMEFGIQMITPTAEAVSLRHSDDATQSAVHEMGLLLPEIKVIQQAATLIVSSHLFRSGDKLTCTTSDGVLRQIVLTELTQDNGLFAQFRFTPLESMASYKTTASQEKPERNDFEMLWNSI
ncbi:MAG: hypothetical protein IDH49_00995 [Gammaproteobacteria bacterium]|nr:hypothetical protein [Gammaproteobacteria bacterium]